MAAEAIAPAAARALFDLGDDGTVYLSCAGRSPLLRASHAAGIDGVAQKLRPWGFPDADPYKVRRALPPLPQPISML